MFYPRQPATSVPASSRRASVKGSRLHSRAARGDGHDGIHLAGGCVKVCTDWSSPFHIASSAPRAPLKISETFLQGPNSAYEQTPHPEKTPASHFLKLGCARLIRQIYAQLHRSNSPSYRRGPVPLSTGPPPPSRILRTVGRNATRCKSRCSTIVEPE